MKIAPLLKRLRRSAQFSAAFGPRIVGLDRPVFDRPLPQFVAAVGSLRPWRFRFRTPVERRWGQPLNGSFGDLAGVGHVRSRWFRIVFAPADLHFRRLFSGPLGFWGLADMLPRLVGRFRPHSLFDPMHCFYNSDQAKRDAPTRRFAEPNSEVGWSFYYGFSDRLESGGARLRFGGEWSGSDG